MLQWRAGAMTRIDIGKLLGQLLDSLPNRSMASTLREEKLFTRAGVADIGLDKRDPLTANNGERFSLKLSLKGKSRQRVCRGVTERGKATPKGLTKHCGRGRLEENMDCLDEADIVLLLQGNITLSEGKRIHDYVIKRGLDGDTFLANLLVRMYGKLGALLDARSLFNKLHQRNVETWNALILAYAQHGHWKEAFQIFLHMQHEGMKPNKNTFISILSGHGRLKEKQQSHQFERISLKEGKFIHDHMMQSGLERDKYLANLLLSMYARCGSSGDARQVFDKMYKRDVVSWNAMITTYVQHGHGKEAIQLFGQMQQDGMKPNKVTFISVLGACDNPATLSEGEMIHACIVARGLESDVVVGTAIVNMYGKCGTLDGARSVFDKMHQHDVVSWTAIINACVQHGHGKEALQLFQQMQQEGVKPNKFTFVTVLGACASLAAISEGESIHQSIIDCELELDHAVGIALINMYGKCSYLEDARSVFDRMQQHDVVSWTAMIAAYAQQGHGNEALHLFRQMQQEGVKPNNVTFVSVLSACDSVAALAEGEAIHACITADGLESDVFVGTALVTMYAKCGSLEDARSLFDKMHVHDAVCWTAMITAYTLHGDGKEALQLFWQMQHKGVKPSKITFISTLSACAILASLPEGEAIHACIVDNGLESDIAVGNALVSMYGKCGSVEDAHLVFDKMHQRDVISWNAMIAAYAQHGHGNKALLLFQQMQQEGVRPDKVTFVSLLSACSHAGLLDEACHYFASMIDDHSINPSAEHCNCMIDLFGRAGQLDKAEDFIYKMSVQSDALVWITLLGACRIHNDGERGKRAAEHVMDLDPHNATPYILLSNIYTSLGRWDDGVRVRKLMTERGVKQEAGCKLD